MKKCIVIFLLILSTQIFAQNKRPEFGHLSPNDLKLKECSFEKEAPAVVIFDYGDSRFLHASDGGFYIQFKRHTRIKIFNEGGYDQAEIIIPLHLSDTRREKATNIKGYTYNWVEGGLQQTPLDISQIYEEKVSEYLYQKKFAMPQVKDSSIIEFTYTIESPFHVHFRDWEFQNDIPTIYSQYTAAMIPFYSYRYRLQGTSKTDLFKSYEKQSSDRSFAGIKFHDMIYEFGLNNVPSFMDESYITSRNDYVIKIDFQLVEITHPTGYKQRFMDTWPKLANDLLEYEDFGKYIKKATKWAEKNASQYAAMPEDERLNAIINMVKSTYKWNYYNGKYAQKDFKEFQKSLTGNIANINLLTLGILKANNIDAEPVIISTRKHGKVTNDFPYSDFFNYVLTVVKINNQYLLIDATDPFCPNQLIPSKCINGIGFIVKKDNEAWVNIETSSPSLEKTTLKYAINPEELTIQGKCEKQSTGYIAMNQRSDFYSSADNFKNKYKEIGINEDDDIVVSNLMDENKPFKFSFNFNQKIDVIEDQIILHPFAHFPIKSNPFKQNKRTLPIDIVNKKAYQYNAIIEIPEGYKIDVLPQNKIYNKSDLQLSFMAQQTDKNKLQIFASYKFNQSTYPASKYEDLKEFMNKVTQILNSKIVLVQDEQLTMK
nr:DUF3857 domain-containing protein [uncultured Carboxylicivirga sp.]